MWANIVGGIILAITVLLVLFFAIFYIYTWKIRRKNSEKLRKIHHKYSVVDFKGDPKSSIDLKKNKIQPPYKNKVKVKIYQPKEVPRKDKIQYDADLEKELLIDKTPLQQPQQQNDIFEKSLDVCKETFAQFYDYISPNQFKPMDTKLSASSPNIIEIDDKMTLTTNFRLPRADSVYEAKLGKLLFTLTYLHREEYFIIHLISGRNITSADEISSVSMTAVGVLVEGQPESEVLSSPDEVPNPEFDQEFAFPLKLANLINTTIRFVIWDIISSQESVVIGFIRLPLIHFQNSLATEPDGDSVVKEIKSSLEEQTPFLGELLISLMYDIVTDKINLIIKRGRFIDVQEDDVDLHIKISLLLDNSIIQTKRSEAFAAGNNITINQTFEFDSLATDLDKLSEKSRIKFSPSTSKRYDNNTIRNKIIQDTGGGSKPSRQILRNNIGILFTLRAVTANRTKRTLGNIYLGKTKQIISDAEFHWIEMVKNFDKYITQWHQIKQEEV